MALKAQIDITADASGVKTGVNEAKKSINALGVAVVGENTKSSKSIDNYIKKLQQQQQTMGMSSRELEVYKLGLRGASDAQIKAADSALKMSEAYAKGSAIGAKMRTNFMAAAALSTAAAGAIAALVISSINAADHLNDLSKTTGLSVENLAGLQLAAKQSGTDLDGLAASISKLSVNMGKDAEKFRALGITAKDPLEAFKQLADIFVAIDDPQMRAALGAEALGKSWQSAAPAMAEGGKRIGEMVAKGTKLSGVTQQLADDADKFNDQLEELKTTVGGFGSKIASEMLPALNDIISAVQLAYQESGKLSAAWTAMGALGTFLFTDDFASATVKIKTLQTELAGLEGVLASQTGGMIDNFLFGKTYEDTKQKIVSVKAQIADLIRESQRPPPETAKAATDPKLAGRVANFIKPEKTLKGRSGDGGEAKAQLDFDLQQIRNASAATIGVYANAEKVMQAMRSANLIDEKEYYAAKLGYLNLNSQAQEAELQAQIERMQQEKLTGKDKLDNQRKIAEAEAKLAKIRGDATANVQVLSIQQADSIRKVAEAYKDATEAAQDYLSTIQRQYDREIEGVGRGAKFKEDRAERNKLEDKFTGKKQELSRDLRNNDITAEDYAKYLQLAQDTYNSELSIYENSRTKLEAKQAEWTNGATAALEDYRDKSLDIAGQTAEAFTNAFQNIEDALVKFVTTGKLDFKSFADSLIADFARIQIKQLMGSMMGGKGGDGIFGMIAGLFGGASGRAIGGPVSSGGLYQVNEKGPEILNMNGKQYLMMGNQSGSVTANNSNGGGGNVTVNVTSTTGDPAEIRRSAAAGAKSALNLMSGARRYG